jgi:hypothetical protein
MYGTSGKPLKPPDCMEPFLPDLPLSSCSLAWYPAERRYGVIFLTIFFGVLSLVVAITYLKVGHRDSLYVAFVLFLLAFLSCLAMPLFLEG